MIEDLLVYTVVCLRSNPIKSVLLVTVTHRLAGYRLSEELAGDHHHAAGDEERDGPLVEQLECEVIHRDLHQVS